MKHLKLKEMFCCRVAKNCFKLDFQGIKFIWIMQLFPWVLPSHECVNEQISPFIRIYHTLFMIWCHTYTTSTKKKISITPQLTHPQKWTTDLLFQNNRIYKHRSNHKIPFCMRVVVINVWFLKLFQVKPVPTLTKSNQKTFSVIPVSCCQPCATVIK